MLPDLLTPSNGESDQIVTPDAEVTRGSTPAAALRTRYAAHYVRTRTRMKRDMPWRHTRTRTCGRALRKVIAFGTPCRYGLHRYRCPITYYLRLR